MGPRGKSYVIYFLTAVFNVQVILADLDQSCNVDIHPEPLHHNRWRRRYNMEYMTANGRPLFQGRIIYKSNQIRPDVTPEINEDLSGFNVTRSAGGVILLYETENIYVMRKTTFTLIYSFYAGDTAVIHVFDPTNKIYTRSQLGYHTGKYFVAIPRGHYYAIDIERHTEEKFIVMGLTFVLGNSDRSHYEFVRKQDVLNDFPKEKQVIEELYSRMKFPKL